MYRVSRIAGIYALGSPIPGSFVVVCISCVLRCTPSTSTCVTERALQLASSDTATRKPERRVPHFALPKIPLLLFLAPVDFVDCYFIQTPRRLLYH